MAKSCIATDIYDENTINDDFVEIDDESIRQGLLKYCAANL